MKNILGCGLHNVYIIFIYKHIHIYIYIISRHESHHEIDEIHHFILRISAYVSMPCDFLKVYVKSNTYLLYSMW